MSEKWATALAEFDAGPQYFAAFAARAADAAAEIIRTKSLSEAKSALHEVLRTIGAKKVVGTNSAYERWLKMAEELTSLGIEYFTNPPDIRIHAEDADAGISTVLFGVAETGSVVQDATAIEERLVSTLPPVHIVFLDSGKIVKDTATAAQVISRHFTAGYVSFITGPSRTADIERVLTIGVHGPTRFIVLAVDETI